MGSDRNQADTTTQETDSDNGHIAGSKATEGPAAAFARRSFLAAVGLGAVASTAGCLSGSGQSDANNDIHPQFGYSGSADEEPPVQPDHEIQTLIQPREGVPIPEFFFEPTGLLIEPGDTVRFTLATPDHTVTAYHPGFGRTQRVPDGVPPFSSPVLPGGAYWLYTFETEGVYDFLCAPHEVFGMVGRIVIGSASGPAAKPIGPPSEGQGPRPPELTARLVLGDPALTADAIVDNGRVSWSDIDRAHKRLLIRIAEGGGGE